MLQYLLSDEESLQRYQIGEFPSVADLKRRMVKCARRTRFQTTDSHFRLETEMAFEEIDSLAKVFSIGLAKVSRMHISQIENRLFVKDKMQNAYQELLPHLPPLVLQAARIFPNFTPSTDIPAYYSQSILPNNRFTAILSEKLIFLDLMVEEYQGLMDLHIHLNGSLETDIVWQDHLASPDEAYKNIKKAFEKPSIKEQFEQESHLFEPDRYLNLLRIAKRIRKYFYAHIFPIQDAVTLPQDPKIAIENILNDFSEESADYQHPFLDLVSEDISYRHLMSVECLMYVAIFKELDTNGNEVLASLFHFYLLILGFTNRMLVQQPHQYGFEQFQKYTVNNMRKKSEEIYLRRYFQLHGNDLRHIRFMEGRFNPSKDEGELVSQIEAIYMGWASLGEFAQVESHKTPKPVTDPTLKLIAHFIKEPDSKRDDYIRHKSLRKSLFTRGRTLSGLIRQHQSYKKRIVGIDAASSEFDTPAEVFAPTFRLIERDVIAKRTYHAGEDFHHLISGLRAVFEAITFCGLTRGDRVGHAVATGISAKMWVKTVPKTILIPKGEYLDNLIFARFMINVFPIEELLPAIPAVEDEIGEIIKEIYGNGFSINEYNSSWLMRDLCPIHAFSTENGRDIAPNQFFQKEMDLLTSRVITKSENDFLLYRKYHELHYRQIAEQIRSVDTEALIDRKGMKLLQLALLKMMASKGLAIETLPTSNVRIGIHKDFSTYHLSRWMKWRETGHEVPDIVVGSDDTGIFATNIYNEYANIHSFFNESKGWQEHKTESLLKKFNDDSENFKFT